MTTPLKLYLPGTNECQFAVNCYIRYHQRQLCNLMWGSEKKRHNQPAVLHAGHVVSSMYARGKVALILFPHVGALGRSAANTNTSQDLWLFPFLSDQHWFGQLFREIRHTIYKMSKIYKIKSEHYYEKNFCMGYFEDFRGLGSASEYL